MHCACQPVGCPSELFCKPRDPLASGERHAKRAWLAVPKTYACPSLVGLAGGNVATAFPRGK
eukprot:5673695-Pyramimonas_sp.AAC.1